MRWLGGRTATDSGSHGGGGGLVGVRRGRAFWHFGPERPEESRNAEEVAKSGDGRKSAHLGRGRVLLLAHSYFSWNAVSSPPRAVNKLRAGARGAKTHFYGPRSGLIEF